MKKLFREDVDLNSPLSIDQVKELLSENAQFTAEEMDCMGSKCIKISYKTSNGTYNSTSWNEGLGGIISEITSLNYRFAINQKADIL